FETKVGGVLRGETHATPPQDALVFDDVVEPVLAEVFVVDVHVATRVFDGANEGERAGDVVVGYDQGYLAVVGDEPIDEAPAFGDATLRPALERPSHINANHLAENAGVDLAL